MEQEFEKPTRRPPPQRALCLPSQSFVKIGVLRGSKNDYAKKESRVASVQRRGAKLQPFQFCKFYNFVAKKPVTPAHLSSGIAQPRGGGLSRLKCQTKAHSESRSYRPPLFLSKITQSSHEF